MRLLAILLIVGGIVALAVPSFTFFTHERVADVGFFAIDVSRPHTVILNPIVGVCALAIGGFMLVTSRSRGAAV